MQLCYGAMENRSYRIEVVTDRERLKSIGPLIPGAWSRHDDELGREAQGEFLIDTGAFGAMIDYDVAVTLQLREQGAREIHGIHGYGTLQQYLAKVCLPAKTASGADSFEQIIECVGVPALLEKSREQNAQIIGILGRAFLQTAYLEIDCKTGRIILQIG
jgi:hypothetical protein